MSAFLVNANVLVNSAVPKVQMTRTADFFSPSEDYIWTGHNTFYNLTVLNWTGIDIVNRSDYWGDNHYTSANIDNWDTAYSWGNHSEAGYLTSFTELDPVWSVEKVNYCLLDNASQTIITNTTQANQFMFNATWGIMQNGSDIIMGYIGDLI
jgi:hypothetical protein